MLIPAAIPTKIPMLVVAWIVDTGCDLVPCDLSFNVAQNNDMRASVLCKRFTERSFEIKRASVRQQSDAANKHFAPSAHPQGGCHAATGY